MSEILRAMTLPGLQPGEVVAVIYQDGDIEEGQPAGAGWSVTRVYEHYDVYYRVDPGLDELEDALSAAMRRVAGISDDLTNAEKDLFTDLIAGTTVIELIRPFRLKLTEEGIKRSKPRHGAWAVTLLHDYFEVYHQPGLSRAVLEQALAEAVIHDPNWFKPPEQPASGDKQNNG